MTLKQWLTANRYSCAAFAKLLEPLGVSVTPQAVQKWVEGHEPRKPAREAIQRLSGNAGSP